MEQFSQFNVSKESALDSLGKLETILHELGEVGVSVDESVEKIKSAINTIQEDVLRIALLGAFSDGKTSVVAAWLGHILGDMKIDMDESSDQLAIYNPEGLPDQCEIVDTPGLFGDKVKEGEASTILYEDITKKYISEAHLVFYVVDATNPLKDSHKDVARWVLRDLGKLSSTIFVINKMDEVTDLTDQVLFDKQASIKTDNLKGKLQRAANLTVEELSELKVVCIAANPGGRGLDFWFGMPEQYESRSRLDVLKQETLGVLDGNVKEVLQAKTGFDVVHEIVSSKVAEANEQLALMDSFYNSSKQESERISEDIAKGRTVLKRLTADLYYELEEMEKLLLNKMRPLALEDIKAFLEDDIGYNKDDVGYKLRLKIKLAVDKTFEQASDVTKKISLDIASHLDSSESFVESLSKDAVKNAATFGKGISKIPADTIKAAIFSARDALKAIGVSIKFKPWEVTKFTGNVAKWAGPIGAIMSLLSDVISLRKEKKEEEQLAKMKIDIGELIKDHFQDVYTILSDDQKVVGFFAPQLKEFESILSELNAGQENIASNKKKVSELEKRLSALV